jgi:hypothetical protein
MAFTGTAVIPPGDFLAHAREWTGLPTVKLLGLMRGASKVSGGSSSQHATLVAAYRADAAARQALGSAEDPGALLERLRREPSATGQALNDYLDFVGYRLLDGFDISNSCALGARRTSALHRTAIDETGAASDLDQPAEVRSHVPEEHREATTLLEEARIGYSVRDERCLWNIWASGLMRRAALAAGRRLAEWASACRHFVFTGYRRDVRDAVERRRRRPRAGLRSPDVHREGRPVRRGQSAADADPSALRRRWPGSWLRSAQRWVRCLRSRKRLTTKR